MRWWLRASVQIRSAIAATAVLIVLSAFASAALVILLQRSLVQGIDATSKARAAGVAAQVRFDARGQITDPTDLDLAITAEAVRRSWVQVLNGEGEVIDNSSDIRGVNALSGMQPDIGDIKHVNKLLPFDEDAYRVLALGGSSNGYPFTVLVGQSLGPVQATTRTVLSLLAAGVPVLLVFMAVAAFVFAHRSLRPVEAIRQTVASINERDLSERVVVPPASDPVSRLAVTMNAMLARLELAQRTQRQFVADASHELRSPIATLTATAEINLAHPDSDDARNFPVVVLEESRRLEHLVYDMLTLARADERGLRPAGDDVDLDDVLDAERQRVSSISELQVVARITPTRVTGDLHQLQQVVRNLVDNAVQHARSRIELSVVGEGADAVLEVFDDGPGIAEADRERIFHRFVRLEESRDRASGGSGLGLAIVREIVTAHHGTVAVVDSPVTGDPRDGDPQDGEPQDGKGARFRLTLPAA